MVGPLAEELFVIHLQSFNVINFNQFRALVHQSHLIHLIQNNFTYTKKLYILYKTIIRLQKNIHLIQSNYTFAKKIYILYKTIMHLQKNIH